MINYLGTHARELIQKAVRNGSLRIVETNGNIEVFDGETSLVEMFEPSERFKAYLTTVIEGAK